MIASDPQLIHPLYVCCISGAIGVGKTTTVAEIYKYLDEKYPGKVHIIREYIDGKMKHTSNELLKKYLKGRMSDETFQSYIQNYYLHELKNPEIEGKIVLMERCMSDSIAIFCNNANRKYGTWLPGRKNLEDLVFTVMYNNCIDADAIAGVPNYFKKNFEFSKIKTDTISDTVSIIKDIIDKDIIYGIKNRVVGLYNDSKVCFERIKTRSRDGESAYTEEDININCNAYDQLYDLIEDPSYEEIRVFDLGILFHKRK